MKLVHMNAKKESPGVHIFCPTHWTRRVESCTPTLNNYNEPRGLQTRSLTKIKQIEMKVRTGCIQVQMTKFKFYFACLFIAMVLKQTDNSSKTHPNLTKPKVKEELELAKIAMRALRKNK